MVETGSGEKDHASPAPGLAGLLATRFVNSKLTPILIGFSILLGGLATLILPREEEPQIIAPNS